MKTGFRLAAKRRPSIPNGAFSVGARQGDSGASGRLVAIGLALMFWMLVLAPAQGGDTNSAVKGLSGTNIASPVSSLSGYVLDDKYKLHIGDKVSLQILEDRGDAPKSLIVADSGELDVPYIGRVTASDKTCKEVAGEVKSQLEKEYYYRATVVIALDVANKNLGRVYVWGQVKNQGPIELLANENLTAGKAIVRAQGFGDFADKKKVKVVRPAGPDGKGKQMFLLNMVEILEEGKTEKDVLLQPDDSVIVSPRGFNF